MNTAPIQRTIPHLTLIALIFVASPFIFTWVTAESSSLTASSESSSAYILKPAIEPSPYEWVKHYPLISHALGGIGGYDGTNSLEALVQAYRSGQRIFEGDLSVTSDGHLVLRHDWEAGTYPVLGQKLPKSIAPMSLKRFQSLPIQQHYTPITYKQLVSFMSGHPDMMLITDTKEPDSAKAADIFKRIVKETTEVNADILRRIIPQLYEADNFEAISGVYPFTQYIYTLYMNQDSKDQIMDDIMKRGIHLVVMDENRYTPEFVQALRGKGVYTYINTINDVSQIRQYRNEGVQGVMTDFVVPGDL
ncbi:phosphatidylinositol-specific phospholipase C/glycerophosphodiester phosphodiesterase family protein [Paenibacillus solisilvae]|uniref:Phosphatidylinositol-specific phospholipase C/glycerophosphodiester phosphodiesterase family protein n=1 Tax=Paenibacillus solisilvae TaxID=2486751 RepID=A0ABW0W4P3_9BACL